MVAVIDPAALPDGHRLRVLRVASGLDQHAVAELAGVSQTRVSLAERRGGGPIRRPTTGPSRWWSSGRPPERLMPNAEAHREARRLHKAQRNHRARDRRGGG